MKFCQPHWEQLRAAIAKRGLSALVAEGGEQAARNLVRELEEGQSIDSFDPLMAAHNAIFSNAMQFASDAGQNPLIMLDGTAPDEMQCPVCFLNGMSDHHDEQCTDVACQRPKGYRYEWMIDRAADDALETWRGMGTAAASGGTQ